MGKIELLEESVEELGKTFDTVEEMFLSIENDFKKRHPVQHWFDEFTDNWRWPFPFAHHVIFSNPWMIVEEMGREIRWAWQRVFIGFDERVEWSIDYWLTDIMLKVLPEFRKNRMRIFHSSFPKDYLENETLYTDEENSKIYEEAIKDTNQKIDKMIFAFECSKKMQDSKWKGIEEYEELKKQFNENIKVFIEHYHELLD